MSGLIFVEKFNKTRDAFAFCCVRFTLMNVNAKVDLKSE